MAFGLGWASGCVVVTPVFSGSPADRFEQNVDVKWCTSGMTDPGDWQNDFTGEQLSELTGVVQFG
ncbi:MAG TPA: hypothetical protein QF695_13455, partial [Arenicellales bacterium]|nr:hypothetical protein [Arenicellales bacterium]